MNELRHFGIKPKLKRDKYSHSYESACRDCGKIMDLPEYARGDPIHSTCTDCTRKKYKENPKTLRPSYPRGMLPGQGA